MLSAFTCLTDSGRVRDIDLKYNSLEEDGEREGREGDGRREGGREGKIELRRKVIGIRRGIKQAVSLQSANQLWRIIIARVQGGGVTTLLLS